MKIVAMDLGKNKTVVCYYEGTNGAHRFLTVPTRPQAIHDAIVAQPADRVVMEIGSAAGWIFDMATSLNLATQVANTNHEAWRWKNVKKKGDRDDALRLARLSVAEQLPTVHMPKPEVRQKRATIAYRHSLVERRTAIKNDIRAILDRQGLTMAVGKSGWTLASMAYLRSLAQPLDQCKDTELWRGQLSVELQQYEAIEAAIGKVEEKLNALGQADEKAQLLQTIPGVGLRLAEAVVAYIDDPKRFKNGKRPVVCMDETSKQLIAEVRMAIAATPGHPQRYDGKYRRCGVANIFMFTEPLGGWRRVRVTEHRKMLDWVGQMRILLEEDYPDAEAVVLIMDNLNTHSIGSLYEAFEPAKARELARRLEIHYTPKHGSWLNIAESELSVLGRQCLDRHIESIERLASECEAWNVERNKLQKGVYWQFTTANARIKLKRLYQHVQT